MSDGGTGVFVLGMHRSGTSATTRAINLLGVPVAAEDELKPPSPNNPTGFWEVPQLTDFNNRLLSKLGGSSLGPPPLAPGWSEDPALEARRRRARKLFARAHRTDAWVWKDPRNCVLFPFWRTALDVRPVVVLVHRDPAPVARSLEARQGLSAAMSFAVWERYMRGALAACEALPVFVAPYSRLVADPAGWAHEVAAFLGDQGLGADPSEGARRVAELIRWGPGGSGSRKGSDERPGPRPTTGSTAGDRPRVGLEPSEAQRATAAAIEALAGPHERFSPPTLPPETAWTEPLLAERRRADVMREQMEERLKATRRRARAALAGRGVATDLPKQRSRQASRRGRRPSSLREGLSAVRAVRRGKRPTSSRDREGGRLPDYLIIGAQKCGTSSLFRYLGESRHVDLPTEKEIHFFDNQFDRGVDWYRAHFPPARSGGKRSLTGESSPYYVFHPLAPLRIRETVPDVRLILLLRNPVHRAVSHYYHELGNGVEELPLPAALDREEERLAGEAERILAEPGYSSFNHRHFSYQARGLYADQLDLWRSVFPADQLLVLNSEDLFDRPFEEMVRVYGFLGLPGKPPRDLGAYNRREYPTISAEVEARLKAYFAPHNARLYELVGEDYGWEASKAA